MFSLQAVVLLVLAISFFTFTAFFGRIPGLRKTPIGFLYSVIWTTIPSLLAGLDKTLTNGYISESVKQSWNKMLYEKHPVVLLFFMTLVIGGASLYLPAIWPSLSLFHRVLMPSLIAAPVLFTRLCNVSKPDSSHVINQSNFLSRLMDYPYDYKLFHPNRVCQTCQIPKPARSKHCSLCKICVARADHHCIWINNCVGRGNYKYFIALLVSTWLLLTYASYMAYVILKPQVLDHIESYPEWHQLDYEYRTDFIGRCLNKTASILDLLATSFLVGGVSLGGIGLLATLTAPLPFALLAYHTYLLWAGMTTNESGKWADWRDDMNEGACYMTDIDPRDSWSIAASSSDIPSDHWGGYDPNLWKRSGWAKRSNQFLVLTQDGQYPRELPLKVTMVTGTHNEWRRVWKLNELDNTYDCGFISNILDVLAN